MSGSLSDKIAGILNAAPASFDPEDDADEITTARVEPQQVDDVNSDEDINLNNFRRRNVALLEDVDGRYEGKRGSRKTILGSDASDDEVSLDNAEEAESSSETEEQGVSGDSDEEGPTESSSDEDAANGDFDVETEDKQFKHMESGDVSGQINKGMCVRQQLSMWENLLEIRIQLQKTLVTANKLPQIATFTDLKDQCGTQFTDQVVESKNTVAKLLDKFLLLQVLLLKKYPETKKLLSGNLQVPQHAVETDEEIPSDTEEEEQVKSDEDVSEHPKKKRKLLDYEVDIGNRHKLYSDYRNSVIQKWNDKTRIASSKSNNSVHSVTSQIDHILSDKEKLIKRTQLKRTDYEILGQLPREEVNNQTESDSQSPEVYDLDIFDDTDFYHHLLRELIEFKSADLTDPVQLGRQWLQLQNLRSKMKRKIDTRATKGRKIRYAVHSKLVNFMAPIEETSWQDEAKSELYGSLFGKNTRLNTV